MRYIPPGTVGFVLSLSITRVVWDVVNWRTPPGGPFTFGDNFEARLANYIRAVEFLLGLATGSIVLIAGSSALHSTGKIPWQFVSPLVELAFCVVYGILFMVWLIYAYEEFQHHNNYTRRRYVLTQVLGFSALVCFCFGYLWLVFAVGIALSK